MKFDFNVLYDFWFGSKPLDNIAATDERSKLWFGKDPQIDEQIRKQFAPWLESFPSRAFDEWESSDKGFVSMVVLLDQVPRNAFRDTAEMFNFDSDAIVLTHEAVERGLHEKLPVFESLFLLMPLEHSEKLSDQQLCVSLLEGLAARAPEAVRPVLKNNVEWARKHASVIERFGRFPHRNAILKRKSTPPEVEFLKEPGSRF